MTNLSNRVLKLEQATGTAGLGKLAVLAAPIPANVDAAWAADILTRYGWEGRHLSIAVQHGHPAVLLGPTPWGQVDGEPSRIWFAASEQFPNATITSSWEGCFAVRHDSEAEKKAWMKDVEREWHDA